MPPSDQDLLLATHRGNDAAARELWSRFGTRLVAYASGILRGQGGQAVAHDVVQRVFCRILEADRRRLKDVLDVGAWLTQATRHEALNTVRSDIRRTSAHERATDAGALAADATPVGEVGDDLHRLRRAITALPPELMEPVLLKHVVGLTFDQIAAALDESRGTLVSRYQRGLQHLRARLHEPGGPPAEREQCWRGSHAESTPSTGQTTREVIREY